MQFNNRSFGPSVPPVTMHLLAINILMWLATFVSLKVWGRDFNEILGLHFWKASNFMPWQFFTYMFMHDSTNFYHIFFNMFSLWMFGGLIERALGAKRYLLYYIVCGLGAALVQELVWQLSWQNMLMSSVRGPVANVNDLINAINAGQADFTMDQFFNSMVTVGASGAVFGILLAFGMLFPNVKLFIIPIPFPVKAKWAVLGYGVLELFFGISGVMDHVAHFAHLGGIIAGIIMILYWKHTGIIRRNGIY